MKLNYTVTPEQYRSIIAWKMRSANMKPVQVAITALLAGVPVVIVLLCFGTGYIMPTNMLLWTLAAILLGALNVILRTCYSLRAQRELERMIASGKVKKGFFKEHTMEVTDRGLEVTYPNWHTVFPWKQYTGAVMRRDTMVLLFDGEIADIIPLKAFSGNQERETFMNGVCAQVRAALSEDMKEMRENIPQDPTCVVRYAYTREAYIRDQRNARRAAALCPKLWKSSQYIRLLMIVFLPIALVNGTDLALRILEGAVLLALLLPYLVVFTPLIDLYIGRELDKILVYRPAPPTTLYLADGLIKIVGDIHCFDIRFDDIRWAIEVPGAVALYLKAGAPLTVPVSQDIINSIYFDHAIIRHFRPDDPTQKRGLFR